MLGRQPQSDGSLSLYLESGPIRAGFSYRNEFGGWLTGVDSDGIHTVAGPTRKPSESGG
ncbi:MAG: hypothetical protein IT207_10095 [Fimbriimonadaceae bacterium]|nr:hypothetical protein [Fimbriimonadaceae bacterium]